ncbi:MAG TPA: thiol reductant ABC exporter subunit CydC [Solirubrobacteraceae bacterium]|nr:thiol reductant ABC exporter subunit CydC [Solirubrobacteraceae bacterium]
MTEARMAEARMAKTRMAKTRMTEARMAEVRTLRAVGRLERGEGRRLALSIALSAGAMAAAIGLLGTSGYLISRAAQRPPILLLMVAIVAVRAFGVVRAGLRYAERLSSHDLAFRQLARLRVRFFAALAPLVPGQHPGRARGELLARFVADVDTLQDLYLRSLIPAVVALLVTLGVALAAWIVLPAAGATMLVSLALAAIALPWLAGRVAVTATRRQAGARARLLQELVQSIDGAPELAVAGRAPEHVQRLRAADAELARLGRRDALAGALTGGLASLFSGVGLLALLLVAIPAIHEGALGGVLLAALAFMFLAAYEGILPLPAAARRLQTCATAARRLQDVCAVEPAVSDPSIAQTPSGRGELEMRGVRVRYDVTEPWVLEGVNLRIAPGRRIALRGPSGAGKTTLAELLVRFRDPDAGSVALDGLDIRELAQDDLRRAVLLCSQDAHLFNTSVRENILLARREASEREIMAALRAVELDRWVADLPQGLDTLVGQEGAAVSGGQRQRIALARALISDAGLLILDEPTAHLDAPLARRVMRSFLHAAAGRGVLVITHAGEGLEEFDEVLELRGGALRACSARAGHNRRLARWQSRRSPAPR